MENQEFKIEYPNADNEERKDEEGNTQIETFKSKEEYEKEEDEKIGNPFPNSQKNEDYNNIQSPLGEVLSPENPNIKNSSIKEEAKEQTFNKSPGKTRERLRKLFMKYCDISDETGKPKINARNYIKLLKDSGILDTNLNSCRANIIYCENCKQKEKTLTFEQFLNSLIKIAQEKFPQNFKKNRQEAILLVINYHLLSLLDKLIQNDEANKTVVFGEDNYIPVKYDEEVKIMLNSIYSLLKDIYSVYFLDHLKKAKTDSALSKITPKLLVVFMRDFEISPLLINKQKALIMLDFLVQPPSTLLPLVDLSNVFYAIKDKNDNLIDQDCGVYFTLSRFFVFLTWVAVATFEGIKLNHTYTTAGLLIQKNYFSY